MAPASQRVLVVDDDPDIRETLSEILAGSGYEAVCAGDGAEALAALRAPGPRPGVVLLDLMMPVMSGWQFREEQLRDAAIADVPVVVITAQARVDSGGSPLDAAATVHKPFRIDDLLATIERVLERHGRKK